MNCDKRQCNYWREEGCLIFDPEECSLKAMFAQNQATKDEIAPLKVRFSRQGEWWAAPDDQTCYGVCEPEDFAAAVGRFRIQHEAYGPLLVEYSFDREHWFQWGEIAGEEQYRCGGCGKYFSPKQLFADEKMGCVCLECVIGEGGEPRK